MAKKHYKTNYIWVYTIELVNWLVERGHYLRCAKQDKYDSKYCVFGFDDTDEIKAELENYTELKAREVGNVR